MQYFILMAFPIISSPLLPGSMSPPGAPGWSAVAELAKGPWGSAAF